MARSNILLGIGNVQINNDADGLVQPNDADVLLQVNGGVKGTILKTDDPGAGAGLWKLGTKRAGAVALDNANYVEVEINGVVVKLAIVV